MTILISRTCRLNAKDATIFVCCFQLSQMSPDSEALNDDVHAVIKVIKEHAFKMARHNRMVYGR